MTIEQLLNATVQSYAATLAQREITVDIDCEPNAQTQLASTIEEALSDLFGHAIRCSPAGAHLSLSAIPTHSGTNIELADGSSLSADEASDGVFAIAKAYRALRAAGCTMQVMNCPQGGVAYSINLPCSARAAA